MAEDTLQTRLSLLKKEAGGSRRELARLSGVKDGTIKNWENGLGKHPSKIRSFAEKLGISLEWLRGGPGDNTEQLARFRARIAGTIGERSPRDKLRAALVARSLTIPQLAKLTKYSAGILDGVVNGTGRASETMIEAIVRELPELSKEDLMDGSDLPPIIHEAGREATHGAKVTMQLPPGVKGRYVPLLTTAQAGAWDAGHTDEGYSFVSVLALNVDDRRAFAVTVNGVSMEPELHEGDVVVCSPDKSPPRNGQCAVIRTHSGQAFVKFWHRRDDEVTLESANPDFQPLKFPLAEIAGAWPVVQRTSSGLIQRP